jgi:hypothetical protein
MLLEMKPVVARPAVPHSSSRRTGKRLPITFAVREWPYQPLVAADVIFGVVPGAHLVDQ